jgi:Gas vesicle protein
VSVEPGNGTGVVRTGGRAAQSYGGGSAAGPQPANLGDILERVLDKGLVIAGDIRVNLLDIELLTIKLRLIIASVDTAREIGINWWETDPWLTGNGDRRQLEQENRELRHRLAALESGEPDDLPARDLGVRGSKAG